MPSSAAICDWVMFPKNRSSRILFSRGGSLSSSGLRDSRYSTPSSASSIIPRESATAGASSSPESGASRETVEYALADSRPSSTSSSDICRCAASSLTVGARPSRCASSPIALVSESLSSCSRRGTRTAQPLSLKWRLISPTMVGVAYVENSTPRPRTNRSIDLMSPMVATWVRSSSHSPRLRNRRARYSTRGRCSSTRVALILARSGSPAGSTVSRSNSSLACVRSGEECSDRAGGGGSSLTVTSTSTSSVTWTSYSLLNSSAPALGEDDRDPVVGSEPGIDRAGEGGKHRPRERVARRHPGLRRVHRHGDGHQVGAKLEDALQVSAGNGLGEQHRARLVDRDTQVLDLVKGEVEPSGESGGGGAQHGQVGALGRHLDLHVVSRLAAPWGCRRRGGIFGHVSPSLIVTRPATHAGH